MFPLFTIIEILISNYNVMIESVATMYLCIFLWIKNQITGGLIYGN